MLTLFPVILAMFLTIYEYRNYKLLRRSEFLAEVDGVKVYRLNVDAPDNAVAVRSLVFGRAVVIIGDVREDVLAHEEGHLRQPNLIVPFFVLSAFVIAYDAVLTPLLIVAYKVLFAYLERGADLYAYERYGVKYRGIKERPSRRLERLKAWLLDTHAPDWVREKEEYYDKKTGLFTLFLRDVL